MRGIACFATLSAPCCCQGDEKKPEIFLKRFVLLNVPVILDVRSLAEFTGAVCELFEKAPLIQCKHRAVICTSKRWVVGSGAHFSEPQGNV
jgi:hypothetical protein